MADNIIKLEHPIPADVKSEKKGMINELRLGQLKAKHLKLFPKSFFSEDEASSVDPTEFLPIIAGLANIPQESVEEIAFSDLFNVIEIFTEYLGNSMPQSQ